MAKSKITYFHSGVDQEVRFLEDDDDKNGENDDDSLSLSKSKFQLFKFSHLLEVVVIRRRKIAGTDPDSGKGFSNLACKFALLT